MKNQSQYALTLLLLLAPCVAQAVPSPTKVFATSFFSPEAGDPDPGLTGVLEIDLATGATTTFIPEAVGGLLQPTDIVLDVASDTLYVSTQGGTIWHYDANTGAPLASNVGGSPVGTFAVLPTAGFGDGVNSLLLRDNGTLLAATAFGSLSPFNLATGSQQADLAMGLAFPSGLDTAPGGDVIVATGDPFGGPGAVVSVDSVGTVTTLVGFTDTPGIQGAGNPTIVFADGDFDADGDVDNDDFNVWAAAYGGDSLAGDANGDGAVDSLDYTIFREQFGDEARIVVTDLFGNRLMDFALDGTDGGELAIIPPDIPDPLPPTADEDNPSNSPSEVLVTDQGTLLVSTLGLTRRPDNRGALLEFDRDGNLLQSIADELPPLSGIAFAPRPASSSTAVPEPGAVVLLAVVCVSVGSQRRTRYARG